jgi:hypothetical protein
MNNLVFIITNTARPMVINQIIAIAMMSGTLFLFSISRLADYESQMIYLKLKRMECGMKRVIDSVFGKKKGKCRKK